MLHAEKDATQVDVHYLRPIVGGLLRERPLVAADAGVVDQDVETAKARDGGVDGGLDLLLRTHFNGYREDVAAGLLEFGQQAAAVVLASEVADPDVRALEREEPTD